MAIVVFNVLDMSTVRCDRLGISLVTVALSQAIGLSPPVLAQIVPDNTLGAESSIVTPNVEIEGGVTDRIDGGAIRQSNLFHSFQEFNVGNGGQVHFANPIGIENILGRVTGSNVSEILGTLGVLGDANLFLVNPNGIFFGPNAQLDIGGSFFASTQNGLVFENGYEFSAIDPEAPPLLTLNITPGLQYGANSPAAISNAGALSTGQDLTLVGGNLNLTGSLQSGGNLTLQATDTLNATDSTIQPFVAAAGEELLLSGERLLSLDLLNHPQSGLVSGGDTILRSANPVLGDARYTTGGSFSIEQLDGMTGNLLSDGDPIVLAVGDVRIGDYTGASLHVLAGGSVEFGNVTIDNTGATDTTINSANTTVIPGTSTPYSALSAVPLTDGTTLNVNGNTQATLDVRAGIDWTQSPFTGVPAIATATDLPAGSVPLTSLPLSDGGIETGDISITQPGGLVFLTNQYRANPAFVGDINIGSINTANLDGGGSVVIDARGGTTLNTIDVSGGDRANLDFNGNGSDVTLLADGEIFLPFPSFIFSFGLVGGNITLTSNSAIVQENAPAGTSASDLSNIESQTVGVGTGGDISLSAPVISVGGNVQNNLGGEGRSGDLTVTANSLEANNSLMATATFGSGDAGKVTIDASTIALNGQTLVGSVTVSDVGGNTGDIEVNANTLTAIGGGQIFALAIGMGNIGNVTVTATDSIELTGTASNGFPSGIGTNVFPGAVGNGGRVNLQTGSLSLRDGAQIRASTRGVGDGGSISVRADEITIDGAVFLPELAFPVVSSAIVSEVVRSAEGQGNQIEITTDRLSVSNGGLISASTRGVGNAGGITISATESVSFDGNPGAPLFPSGAFVGTLEGGMGQGGTLTIVTPSLSVTNGAQLEALTESGDDAGNINIDARDSVFISGVETGLFSNAAEGSTGNGGAIVVNTSDLTLTNAAEVSTRTEGEGNSGLVTINADRLLVENNALLVADSPGAGDAGTILLRGDRLRVRQGGQITVTSENSGAAGNLEIVVPEIQLEGGILGAETVEGDRANIVLDTSDLQLREQSLITTNATGTATGGNINIDTTTLVALENSDITANAEQSFGGRVTIAAQGIFGTEFRDRLTPESDITATSELGAEFSGTVTILTPDIDAAAGLVELSSNTTDPADRVVAGCAAAQGSSFTVTGRGGLPEDPTATIRGQTVWEDLRTVVPQRPGEMPEARSTPIPAPIARETPGAIVEATSWIVREDGIVELVAERPQMRDLRSGLNCQDLPTHQMSTTSDGK